MFRLSSAIVSFKRGWLMGLELPGAGWPCNALVFAERVAASDPKEPVRQERAWKRASSVGQPTSPLRGLALMAAAALFATLIPFEARLYLHGKYQRHTSGGVMYKGHTYDPDLGAVISGLTQDLLGPQPLAAAAALRERISGE